MSSMMPTVKKLSSSGLATNLFIPHLSLQTCVSSYSPVQLDSIEDLQKWLRLDSPANLSVLPERKKANTTTEICGAKLSKLLDKYSQNIVFSKTFQDFCQLRQKAWRTKQDDLFADTSEQFCETFPKAGLMQGGVCWEQTMWAADIHGKDYGYMLPTPRRSEYKGCGAKGSKSHKHMLDRDYLCAVIQDDEQKTKHLNPDWVEALMGWQIGWSSVAELPKTNWDYNWEDFDLDGESLTKKNKDHKHRLMAIGNGQVPLCVAVAWTILHGRARHEISDSNRRR